MKLMWGEFQIGSAGSGTRFLWSHIAITNNAEFVIGFKGSCNVIDACLFVNDQADAKTKMDAVQAAFIASTATAQSKDLLFKNDDNSNSTNSILTADTVGGVLCKSLVWSDEPGAQFATWRKFSCVFEWEKSILTDTQPTTILLDYQETLTISGGLPLFQTYQPINSTTPIQQTTTNAVIWQGTQAGFAKGYEQIPSPNAALWTTTPPLKSKTITHSTGRRTGDKIRGRQVNWTYQYEFATEPLIAAAAPRPTEWTGAQQLP